MNYLRIFLIAVLLLAGCKSADDKARTALFDIFKDFEYAGSVHQFIEVQGMLPGHLGQLPSKLMRGDKYVFFHRAPLKIAEMETVTIPARLRSHGFNFKPVTFSDLAYPDAGGPLFDLDFRGSCNGKILNVVDKQIMQSHSLSTEWATEAFILEVNENC